MTCQFEFLPRSAGWVEIFISFIGNLNSFRDPRDGFKFSFAMIRGMVLNFHLLWKFEIFVRDSRDG
jgi:hypothetical protein